jgi:polar amino acid transport system permease protein
MTSFAEATDGRDGVAPAEEIRAVPVRHPGRWVAAAGVLVLVAMLAHSLLSDSTYQWGVFGQYFTSSVILQGLVLTIELTIIAMVIGIALGIVAAIMRLSPNPIVSGAGWVYVWFFRGTPVLVQLLFWYNISALYPRLSLGIPFGPDFVHGNVNPIITAFTAAILGLGLNEGAYMSEIVRAGLLSVDHGQTEAAQALGMTRGLTLRRIVLPQAMRVIIPPTGNETIGMLKTTSLASTIALAELLRATQNIYSRTYQTIPLLIVASIWYITLTSVLSIGQYYLERYFARGSARALPPTPLQRLRQSLITFHAPRPVIGPPLPPHTNGSRR